MFYVTSHLWLTRGYWSDRQLESRYSGNFKNILTMFRKSNPEFICGVTTLL